MRNFFTTGLGALTALAFISMMATAAPPDGFHAELIQLDAPPGYTVAPHIADDVSFDALGDSGTQSLALAEGEYQIERMPSTVEAPALSLIALPITGLEVGGLFDPLGSPAGATVNA